MNFLEILPSIPILFLGFVVWYAKKLNAKIEVSASIEDLNKLEKELKEITKDGITSGIEARKEQWHEINDLKQSVASVEGYLSNANGYKKRI